MEKRNSNPGPHSPFVARWNSARVRQTIDRAAIALDTHPWSLISVLFLLYVHIVMHERVSPLWYDELYTYYIAQAPTFHTMIVWTQHIDLNPPLYYAAARLSMHILHPGPLAVRLPSIIAYFVAALCAYRFVRRQLTPLYGTLAALVLLGSSYSDFSYDARPYALVLGFLGIAALGWQGATQEAGSKRALSLILVVIGGFGMLLSHVLALLAFGSLFFAELVRLAIRRKTDWPLWISLSLPLSSCLLYLPLIQHHSGGVFTPVFQASIEDLFQDYSTLWIDLAPFLAAAMLLIAWVGIKPQPGEQKNFDLTWPEITFSIVLILVPLIVILRFMRSHSMYNLRYGMPAIFGIAILVPYFIAWWTNRSRRAALIVVAVFILSVLHPSSLARILQAHLQPSSDDLSKRREIQTPFTRIQPDLPFVVANGLTFLEMDHRENKSFLSRVYYLVDPQAALEYAHSNVFNGLQTLHNQFPIRAHVEPYDDFIKQHPRFIVFGSGDYPDDWLIQKLLADGTIVRFLGVAPSSYGDTQVYQVTVGPHSTQ